MRGGALAFAMVMAALWGCGGGVVESAQDSGVPGEGGVPGDGGLTPDGPAGGPTDGGVVERDAGDPTLPTAPTCGVAAGGSSGPVAAPTLRQTLPASWDENWLASPAVIDLDGDQVPEIVAARHSVLYAWSASGTLLWRAAFGHSASVSPDHGSTRMWASPVIGDLDGDGTSEIAVGSDADGPDEVNVALYDHTGELRPGWPIAFGTTEVRSIAGADVDGDGVVEILVNKTSYGPATGVLELDGSFHPNWPQVNASCDPPPPAEPCWDFGGYNQNIGAGDLDGDGILDVVSSYDSIGFGVFHGDGSPFPTDPSFTDPVITAVEAYHDLALSQQGWGSGDRSEFTSSPPVVADIDDDGDYEIVLAGDHEHSSSTTNQGITVWVVNHDLTRPDGWLWPKDTGAPLEYGSLGHNIVHTMPSPAVADLDPRPGLEILVPAYDGTLYAFGADGSVLWTYTFATVASPYTGASEPLVADLNGDASPEVIFTTYSSGEPRTPDTPAHLVILDAAGELLHAVELFGRGSMAAPTVADLDGNGGLEIIVSLKDTLGGALGGVQIWDVPGASSNCVLWGTGRGGWLRQGYVPR